MLSSIVTAIVALLQTLEVTSAGSSTITAIINMLVQVLPVLVKEFQDLVPIVQNIIGALKSNTDITQAQLDALQTLEVQYDADFEGAAAAALAQDAPSTQS